jgi:hypothetical protein
MRPLPATSSKSSSSDLLRQLRLLRAMEPHLTLSTLRAITAQKDHTFSTTFQQRVIPMLLLLFQLLKSDPARTSQTAHSLPKPSTTTMEPGKTFVLRPVSLRLSTMMLNATLPCKSAKRSISLTWHTSSDNIQLILTTLNLRSQSFSRLSSSLTCKQTGKLRSGTTSPSRSSAMVQTPSLQLFATSVVCQSNLARR